LSAPSLAWAQKKKIKEELILKKNIYVNKSESSMTWAMNTWNILSLSSSFEIQEDKIKIILPKKRISIAPFNSSLK